MIPKPPDVQDVLAAPRDPLLRKLTTGSLKREAKRRGPEEQAVSTVVVVTCLA